MSLWRTFLFSYYSEMQSRMSLEQRENIALYIYLLPRPFLLAQVVQLSPLIARIRGEYKRRVRKIAAILRTCVIHFCSSYHNALEIFQSNEASCKNHTSLKIELKKWKPLFFCWRSCCKDERWSNFAAAISHGEWRAFAIFHLVFQPVSNCLPLFARKTDFEWGTQIEYFSTSRFTWIQLKNLTWNTCHTLLHHSGKPTILFHFPFRFGKYFGLLGFCVQVGSWRFSVVIAYKMRW